MTPSHDPRHAILVVDDTPENLDIVRDLLKDRHRVLTVKSGQAALDLLSRTHPLPSLILLDIMMPDLDGFETLLRLRRLPGCESVPVVFISAVGDLNSKVRGLTMGAVDYITKPFEPAEVEARVATHLALVDADRLKADIERILRHDLKSPLNAITATASFELENESLDPNLRESLQVIADSGVTMRDMIDLSLDLFKMEQGTYSPVEVPVDLGAVLDRLHRESSALLAAADVTWKRTAPSVVLINGVELLCYSLVANLVRNAIEASPRGGAVELTIDSVAGRVHLDIQNQGEIPLAIRSRLFQKYATSGKVSGTGLGLYSARLIAGALGASLEANTDQPGLTTFRIDFAAPPA